MVKVSFNSALAQKEAAKKEEENSQVLILPPDAKVRAAGDRAWRRPGCSAAAAAARSAPLGGEVLPRAGKRAGDGFLLYTLIPPRFRLLCGVPRGPASR
uniref:Uncharacterized protein n=1 Tax=Otus sunia TaxID=257818 RepID=A0A8C8AP58_9STRI